MCEVPLSWMPGNSGRAFEFRFLDLALTILQRAENGVIRTLLDMEDSFPQGRLFNNYANRRECFSVFDLFRGICLVGQRWRAVVLSPGRGAASSEQCDHNSKKSSNRPKQPQSIKEKPDTYRNGPEFRAITVGHAFSSWRSKKMSAFFIRHLIEIVNEVLAVAAKAFLFVPGKRIPTLCTGLLDARVGSEFHGLA